MQEQLDKMLELTKNNALYWRYDGEKYCCECDDLRFIFIPSLHPSLTIHHAPVLQHEKIKNVFSIATEPGVENIYGKFLDQLWAAIIENHTNQIKNMLKKALQ